MDQRGHQGGTTMFGTTARGAWGFVLASMHQRSIRVAAVLAVAIVTALAGADRASAAGTVAIDSCRALTDTNTTYKLTTDLTSCGDCLVVANNKITIDLQGHSIT